MAPEMRLDRAHRSGRPHFGRLTERKRRSAPSEAPRLGLRWPETALRLYDLAGPALVNVVHRVLFSRPLGRTPTVAVVSPAPGSGCTTIAVALARAAAELGEYSLLVDLAFDSPSLARVLGIHVDDGIDWAVVQVSGLPQKPLWKPLFFDRRARVGLLTPTLTGCRRAYRARTINALRELLEKLAPHLALAIIDAGGHPTTAALPVERLPLTSAVVVDRAGGDGSEPREQLVGELQRKGVVIEAIFETFANAAAEPAARSMTTVG